MKPCGRQRSCWEPGRRQPGRGKPAVRFPILPKLADLAKGNSPPRPCGRAEESARGNQDGTTNTTRDPAGEVPGNSLGDVARFLHGTAGARESAHARESLVTTSTDRLPRAKVVGLRPFRCRDRSGVVVRREPVELTKDAPTWCTPGWGGRGVGGRGAGVVNVIPQLPRSRSPPPVWAHQSEQRFVQLQ